MTQETSSGQIVRPRRFALDARWRRRLAIAALALLALGVAAALAHTCSVAGLRVPLNRNEGWNAYHADAAISGGTLYPQAPSLMVNNYPPLYFYLDGAAGKLVGDDILAGRILSLLAFAAIAVGIAGVVRRIGGGRPEAGVAALAFAAWMLPNGYVGMNDPQLVGQALDVAAIALLLRSPRSNGKLLAAAGLLAVAFFTKHNLVVVPLALVGWLAVVDRRSALRLAAFGLALLVVGLIAFRLVYGVDLISQLASARTYSASLLAHRFTRWLFPVLPALVAASVALALVRKRPFSLLCGIYLALAVAIGVAFQGGSGVVVNAMFDAEIALAITLGFVLTELRGERARALVVAGAAASLVVVFATSFNAGWLTPHYWLDPQEAKARQTARDIAFLRDHRGPAVCQMLNLCYWAGKPATVDVFNVSEAYAANARSEGPLVTLIHERYFGTMEFLRLRPFALPDAVRRAVKANYVVDHADSNGVFLVPWRATLAPEEQLVSRGSAAVAAARLDHGRRRGSRDLRLVAGPHLELRRADGHHVAGL